MGDQANQHIPSESSVTGPILIRPLSAFLQAQGFDSAQIKLAYALSFLICLNLFFIALAWRRYGKDIIRIYANQKKKEQAAKPRADSGTESKKED